LAYAESALFVGPTSGPKSVVIIVLNDIDFLERYGIFARDSMYAKRAYAIALPSVRLSIRLSVTRVISARTVEVRILQFSPYSSPIPLVLQDKFHPEILTGLGDLGGNNG